MLVGADRLFQLLNMYNVTRNFENRVLFWLKKYSNLLWFKYTSLYTSLKECYILFYSVIGEGFITHWWELSLFFAFPMWKLRVWIIPNSPLKYINNQTYQDHIWVITFIVISYQPVTRIFTYKLANLALYLDNFIKLTWVGVKIYLNLNLHCINIYLPWKTITIYG